MRQKSMRVLVLAVILLVGVAGTAHAVTFTDIDGNPHKEAIEEMARLGILEGVGDNRFAPDMELNRAAAAKVAAFLLGYTEEDALEAEEWAPMFDDVYPGMGQHEWALGWINLIAADEVIIGLGDGNYGPGNPLRMVDWVTILTRILQHEEAQMTWPDDYNEMAADLGLDAGLPYEGMNIVDRAEMARMTTTAIFDIERPDGRRIIDIVVFDVDERDPDDHGEEDDVVIYDAIRFSFSAQRTLLPAGGGQTTEITVKLTDGEGRPAANTQVGFFAGIETSDDVIDRSGQLSTREVISDSNGIARVMYTTLAADDDQSIAIMANAPQGDDWTEQRFSILASDTASLVQGRLINPFTGAAHEGADISFDAKDNNSHMMHEGATQIGGLYSLPVLPGDYHVSFHLDFGSTAHYSGEFHGSHSQLNRDNTATMRETVSIAENQTITLHSERGVLMGMVTNIGSDRNLYITRDTGETVIAEVNDDGRFMILIRGGTYTIGTRTGAIIKSGVNVTPGVVTDLGSFAR